MAGTTLGFLKFVLGFDSISFKKGMSEAERDLVRLQKKVEKFGKDMAGLGKKMSIGLTAPLVAFGAVAFKAASDAGELQAKFDTTFGAMSATMNKWAVETGDAMHRSTQTMQEAASTFALFFQTAVDPAQAAEMAKTFAVLAQDLGSFFNVDPSVAMEKLRAGLAGQSEPLQAFAVFLNEAKVQAKGVELGLVKVGGTMTDAGKIIARYNLILEATKAAQGDVARTADSTANQVVAAKAAFQELSVSIGNALLPALTPLIGHLAAAMDWFAQLTPATKTWVVALLAVVAVTGPLLLLMGNLIKIFAGVRVLTLFAAAFTTIAVSEAAAASGAYAFGAAIHAALPELLLLAGLIWAAIEAYRYWKKLTGRGASEGVTTALQLGGGISASAANLGAEFANADIQKQIKAIPTSIGKVGGGKKAKGAKGTDPAKELADRVKAINERINPAQAGLEAYEKELADLTAYYGKTADGAAKLEDAIKGLNEERKKSLMSDLTDVPILEGADAFENYASSGNQWRDEQAIEFKTEKTMDAVAAITKLKTDEMITAWGDMATAAIGSMKRMVTAFKSGDILGGIQAILETVLELVKTLKAVGLIGGGVTVPTGGSPTGATAGFGGFRARGGPTVPGKSYMVGENGPEWFSTKRRGFIHPNGKEGQAQRLVVVPSPYFDVVVDHRAAGIAAPMAGQAAIIGVTGSEMRASRRARRNLLAA